MTIFLYYIGKPRNPNANKMAEEYVRRSTRFARCEMREWKPRGADLWDRHAGGRMALLDPAGEAMDSAAFARLVERSQRDARDLVFLVGGADGLPSELRDRADVLLSLTKLTLPHELARVVLAEQIYRALTMLRGHPYPR